VLLTPPETIEQAAQLIKGGYSFAMRRQGLREVWHPGCHAHRITRAEDYRNQLAYIADNPKQRGLADYPYVHTPYAEQLDPAPEHCRT
jgi:putative transposase